MKPTPLDPEIKDFARRGFDATVNSLQMAIDILQRELDATRHRMGGLQDEPAKRGRGRPPGAAARNGWSADPAERKRDMARRQAKRKAKRQAKQHLHPRDPEHPDHARWLANVTRAARKRWRAMSPAQKQARQAAMQSGRKAEVRAIA